MHKVVAALLCLLLAIEPALAVCPVVDGSANLVAAPSVSPNTITLTTTQSNDIVVVVAATIQRPTGATSTVNTVTSPHVTWQRRVKSSGTATGNSNCGGSCAVNLEVWWGVATSPLSAEPISITLNSIFVNNAVAEFLAFGVNGPSTASPWDTNGSLPAVAQYLNNPPGAAMQVTGVTTNSSSGIVLYICNRYSIAQIQVCQANNAAIAGPPPPTIPASGWNFIVASQFTQIFAGPDMIVGASALNFSSALSNATLSAWNQNITQDWIMIADVMNAGGCSAPPPASVRYPHLWVHE